MHLPSIVRSKLRSLRSAPIDCAIGLVMLALAALAILPSVAFFAACAVIAGIASRLAPAARPTPLRAR